MVHFDFKTEGSFVSETDIGERELILPYSYIIKRRRWYWETDSIIIVCESSMVAGVTRHSFDVT